MRKLIMWNLMSLDGFVEGSNRDISWLNDVWGPSSSSSPSSRGRRSARSCSGASPTS